MITIINTRITRATLFSTNVKEQQTLQADYPWEIDQYNTLLLQGVQVCHQFRTQEVIEQPRIKKNLKLLR